MLQFHWVSCLKGPQNIFQIFITFHANPQEIVLRGPHSHAAAEEHPNVAPQTAMWGGLQAKIRTRDGQSRGRTGSLERQDRQSRGRKYTV